MAKYELDSNIYGGLLRARGPWHKSLERIIKERNIMQLQLWYADGWRGPDLEFLERVPRLEGLYIWDQSGLDVSGVRFLTKLKRLYVMIWNKPSRPIPFDKLTMLESCEMEWNSALAAIVR